MCGDTERQDKETVRGPVGMADASRKVTKMRLKWYGHARRTLENRRQGG